MRVVSLVVSFTAWRIDDLRHGEIRLTVVGADTDAPDGVEVIRAGMNLTRLVTHTPISIDADDAHAGDWFVAGIHAGTCSVFIALVQA